MINHRNRGFLPLYFEKGRYIMTNEFDAWNSFLSSGSVLDYLHYKAIQNANNNSQESQSEDCDEVQHQRTDNKGTEYR